MLTDVYLRQIRHIAAGLSYLHNNEVTHGDVKCVITPQLS